MMQWRKTTRRRRTLACTLSLYDMLQAARCSLQLRYAVNICSEIKPPALHRGIVMIPGLVGRSPGLEHVSVAAKMME